MKTSDVISHRRFYNFAVLFVFVVAFFFLFCLFSACLERKGHFMKIFGKRALRTEGKEEMMFLFSCVLSLTYICFERFVFYYDIVFVGVFFEP